MKYKLLIILLLISSASFSQDFKGTWKGKVQVADSINQVNLEVMIQKDTLVRAVLLSPTFCMLTDSCFYGMNLHLKSTEIKVKPKGVLTDNKNQLKKAPKTHYQEINFSGALAENKNKLNGMLTLNGKGYQIELFRGDTPVFRPQEPQLPYPYYSEDVKFINKKDGTVLVGTLTLPKKEKKFPAVILKGGSLPNNRDMESYHHKPFLLIADYLTRNGIAVLRCDDRGVGRSTGDFMKSTIVDFSGDLLAGYEFLSSRPEIQSNEIGLIGHSEGAIVASIAASQCKDIKFVIMLAGPGISLRKVYEAQLELNYRNGVTSTEQNRFSKKLNETIYRLLNQNLESKAIFDSLMIFKNEGINFLGNPEVMNDFRKGQLFSSLMQIKTSPHNLFSLNAFPSEYIEKLSCPVLSLNGSNDIFVPAAINQEAIRQALLKGGNKDYKILELDSLNHNFQQCKTGSIKESLTIEQTFSPHALDLMARWILEHVEK